jgi:acyl carrier protein
MIADHPAALPEFPQPTPADAIPKRLRELLSFFTGAPEPSLGPTSMPQNTPGWDSAANLNFIAAIEEEFALTIATRDVIKLRTLGDFEAYLLATAGGGVSIRAEQGA